MRRLVVITGFLLFKAVCAQTPTESLELQLESLAEQSEEGTADLIQLAERLQMLKQNPIKLNFATTEDLLQIPYLNIFQAANLIQYRETSGVIYSAYELMAVKGFDQETIVKILPYLNFSPRQSYPLLRLQRIVSYSRHHLLLRGGRILQERRGYTPEASSPYLGSPYQGYFRYRANYGNLLSAGLVLQQDAGEALAPSGQKARVDHWSGHLALRNYGKLKAVIIGDYHASFGQGLALWSSPAFGKSAEATEIKRYAPGFTPFTGSEENRFLRGIATTYQLAKSWELSAFYSSHRQDANLQPDSSGATTEASSLQSTGLHRTEAELADRHSNRLRCFGANLSYRKNNMSVGATAVNYQLDLPLEPGRQLYQRYRFRGNDLSNFSTDFNWLYRDLNFFAEMAIDQNGKGAFTVGLHTNPADGFFLSLLHRRFSTGYTHFYTAPFAESGQSGERGSYLGIQWLLSPIFTLQGYADLYYFSWPRYRVSAPSEGAELMAQLEGYFSRRFTAYLRHKYEQNAYDRSSTETLPQVSDRHRSSTRLHLAYRLSRSLGLATRFERSRYQHARQDSHGLLIFQDIKYRFQKTPLQLTGRYALIEVEDYDARIYAYENDLSYSFSIPPYYGRAVKFYLLADFEFSEKLELQFRYSQTRFFDRQSIGSGNQQINGPLLSELKLQLALKL